MSEDDDEEDDEEGCEGEVEITFLTLCAASGRSGLGRLREELFDIEVVLRVLAVKPLEDLIQAGLVSLGQDCREELQLLLLRFEAQVLGIQVRELCDDLVDDDATIKKKKKKELRTECHQEDDDEEEAYLEGVALINEELLSFGGVVHLLRVFGNQRVEEGVVAVKSELGS